MALPQGGAFSFPVSPQQGIDATGGDHDNRAPLSDDGGNARPRHRASAASCVATAARSRWALAYVCSPASGRSRSTLTFASIAIDRATIEARPPGIWRYLELLPVESRPASLGRRLDAARPG